MPGLSDGFRQALIDDLLGEMERLVTRSCLAGVVLGSGSATMWDLTNEAAVTWAKEYAYDLVSGITDTTMEFLQGAVSDWAASGESLDELVKKIDAQHVFGSVRAQMIAETEVTRAYAAGNLMVWRNDPSVTQKTWYTARDELVCPICLDLDGVTLALDVQFDTGEILVDGPPAHVRCRCTVYPNTLDTFADARGRITTRRPAQGEPGYEIWLAAGIAPEDLAEG